MRELKVERLGRLPYREALDLQDRLVRARRADELADTLLLLEHPPVITLGRGASTEHLLCTPAELERRGIALHECGRGGDVTCHEPGQLVGYPILRLAEDRRDAHRYLRELEQGLIDAVAELGIPAQREQGLTGIWVGSRKLAAIGVRLSTGWITSHGFALNVCNDLDGFSAIVPCGIRDRGVTSISRLLGRKVAVSEVDGLVALHLARNLGFAASANDRLAPTRPSELCSELEGGNE